MSQQFTYSQLHKPTGINHTLVCKLLPEYPLTLLVVKTNILDVYGIEEVGDKLKHVRSCELYGNVQSIQSARVLNLEKSKDSQPYETVILMNYEEEAKISVVRWNNVNYDFDVVSLHFLEDSVLKDGAVQFNKLCKSHIAVDPLSRCAGTVIFNSKLVLLPFWTREELEEEGSTEEKIEVKKHLILDLKEFNINNVKDYCFLYGYSEPTILILHENNLTWEGRLASQSNTCQVSCISLSLNKKQYPIIWSVKSLPHDAFGLIPLRGKIGGGTLLVSFNSIIHLNSRAQYGIATTDFSTLGQNSNSVVSLENEANNCVFMNSEAYVFIDRNVILFSMKDGQMYLLQIFNAGNRVTKLLLTKSKRSAPASSMVTWKPGNNKHSEDSYLLIASKLGNSSLIKFKDIAKKESTTLKRKSENQQKHPRKRRKTDEDDTEETEHKDNFVSEYLRMLEKDDIGGADDDDDMFEAEESLHVKNYSFELVYTLLNIAPMSDSCVSEVPTRVKGSHFDPGYQLVACSGFEKSGKIVILQKNVRPIHIKENQLSGFDSVFSCERLNYKILTKNGTSVLLDENLSPIEKKANIIHDQRTIKAGLITNSTVIQICERQFALHRSQKSIKSNPFTDKIARSAHVLRPHFLIHFSDGSLMFGSHVKQKTTLNQLAPIKEKMNYFGYVTAASLYKDECIDSPQLFQLNQGETVSGRHFCVLCWSSGAIEIYALEPEVTCVFSFLTFDEFYMHFIDSNPTIEEMENELAQKIHGASLYCKQIVLQSFKEGSEPYLICQMSDDQIVIYKSYEQRSQESTPGRLSQLRFRKISTDLGCALRKPTGDRLLPPKVTSGIVNIFQDTYPRDFSLLEISAEKKEKQRFIVLTGDTPVWITSDQFDQLRMYPMTIYGPMTSISTHQDGESFLFTAMDKIIHASLDSQFDYTAQWPTRIVKQSQTIQHVAYEPKKKIYTFSRCREVPLPAEKSNLPEGNYPPPTILKYEIVAYDQFMKDLRITLPISQENKNEHILKLQTVDIIDNGENPYKATPNVQKSLRTFLAIGTGTIGGEDEHIDGRLILYDIKDTISGQKQFDKMAETSVKGPVSAIENIGGYMAIGYGSKINIYYYDWESSQLAPASFIDSYYHVVSIKSINNFLVYGDIFSSIKFLQWKEEGHELTMLGQDLRPVEVYETDFLYDGTNLSMICCDGFKNLEIFEYDPENAESQNGEILVPIGDFHTGSLIQKAIRLNIRDVDTKKPHLLRIDHMKQFNLLVGLDGSISSVCPCDEEPSRLLRAVIMKMYTQVKQTAGLHPMGYRLYRKHDSMATHNHIGKVIDGVLLSQFTNCDKRVQQVIARLTGQKASRELVSQIEKLFYEQFAIF